MENETQQEAPAGEVAEVEEAPNPLFAPEADADGEESAFDDTDDAEALEAEAEPEVAPEGEEAPEKKPHTDDLPPGVALRMAKLRSQRSKARGDAELARAEAKEAKAKLEALTPFEAAINEHYGRFKDPLRELAMDARRMDALEELKDRPEVQRVIALLEARVHKGGAMPETKPTQTQAETKPAAIPEPVAALLRQTATDRIETFLDEVGVKPGFKSILRDHVLGAAGDGAVSIAKADVMRHAREYVQKHGLAESDVVAKGAAKPAPGRPPTPKSSRAGVVSRETSTRREAAAPAGKGNAEPAKTIQAWEQRHASRRAALLSGQTS